MAGLDTGGNLVRKTVLSVALGSAFTILIVFGCSAPSPDGEFDERDRRASSSGDPPARSDGGKSTETPGDCSDHEKVSDTPACDTCTRENCCKYVLECDESPDCVGMQKCLEECESGDLFCAQACHLVHEEGSRILMNMGQCAQQQCASECPSSLPEGGLPDPFADAF